MEPSVQYCVRLHGNLLVPPVQMLPAGQVVHAAAAELCPIMTPYVLAAQDWLQPTAALVAFSTAPYVPSAQELH